MNPKLLTPPTPVTATLKSVTKSLENTAWQFSGSGKVANISIKDHLLSQGKLLGETSVLAGKTLDAITNACEGILAINETRKESNLLLKELVAGQKLAMDRVVTGGALPGAAFPPMAPSPPNPVGGAGHSTGVPAAFGGVGGIDPVPCIPGTNLPQPPLVPAAPASVPASLGTSAMEREAPPGFKRFRLANGQYLTVPESWTPEDPLI